LLELGLRPGPHFKAILDACSEAQLEGAFTDEAGGRAWLAKYLRTHAQGGPMIM
jgi:tRNA nucleotidyltransferase (CCA-adding enzyme)